ncbi:MAG: HPr family phosphocarrier protein [Isosphaeraceae bacterium]|nr:HPr family phosphocarrier protein [Isosphaeraceae bacterium]
MSQDQPIARRRVVILNGLGLHLRPATKFATLAQRYRSEIRVRYNGQESNGKGILDLAMLAAGPGAGLDLEAVGDDAESALAALAALVDARFHETDDGEPLPEESTS